MTGVPRPADESSATPLGTSAVMPRLYLGSADSLATAMSIVASSPARMKLSPEAPEALVAGGEAVGGGRIRLQEPDGHERAGDEEHSGSPRQRLDQLPGESARGAHLSTGHRAVCRLRHARISRLLLAMTRSSGRHVNAPLRPDHPPRRSGTRRYGYTDAIPSTLAGETDAHFGMGRTSPRGVTCARAH